MVQVPMKKSEERTLIPDNTPYEAIVLEVKEQDSRWWIDPDDESLGKKKELNFKFKIIDPEGDENGRWIWGSVNSWLSDNPSNKLRQWVMGILDLDVLPEGFLLDTDDLEGRQCRILVEQWTSKDGERHGNSVGSVRASKVPQEPVAPKEAAVSAPAYDMDEEPF